MEIRIEIDDREQEAVRIAAGSLAGDLRKVLDAHVLLCPPQVVESDLPRRSPRKDTAFRIVVGTTEVLEASPEDLESLSDDKGRLRREGYLISARGGALLILGTDRRGAIYGMYYFCRRILGVSPWTFWADVPVRRKLQIDLPEDYERVDSPSIAYRGIFINDEEELEHWVQRHMGEETIGPRTYAHVFELLLRLGMNYIWPAMHVNSFNANPENGILADRMGIVVGTSHCDMLMRSNQREWRPWLISRGYDPDQVRYDFSIAGRNRDIITQYWEESVIQNSALEVSYTLGMRGIHDSGFVTEATEGLRGEELVQAQKEILEAVIALQERLVAEHVKGAPLKLFIPYKEVLKLYDAGLKVPEDVTIVWSNDNYGHVRRYPGEKEKHRPAGNGLYYHNSYWAPPGMSYTFCCTIPLAQTRNELKKAYEEGIRRLWVTNFGAMKPLELQMDYYATLAWEIGREDAISNDETEFLTQWIDEQFEGGHGKRLAPLLTEFDQLTNARKLEQMDCDVFSQNTYADEGAMRLHRYETFFRVGNRIRNSLPEEERDAFFQLVLMRFHAAYYTNAMFYYADRSHLCLTQGKASAAATYARLSQDFDHARRSMFTYYNQVMSGGRWDGMLTPEDFPPPRMAIFPAARVPLEPLQDHLIVTCPEAGEGLTFVKPVEKWFEIANAGETEILVTVTMPAWLRFVRSVSEEEQAGESSGVFAGASEISAQTWQLRIKEEERFLVEVDWDQIPALISGQIEAPDLREDAKAREAAVTGEITVNSMMTGEVVTVPVRVLLFAGITLLGKEHIIFPPHMEDDGMLVIEAEMIRDLSGAWVRIPNLGRGRGSMVEARSEGGTLIYEITVTGEGRFMLEVHRFPSLNSVGRIRIGVSVDEGEMFVLESASTDEHRGTWRDNVRDGVEKLTMELPEMKGGAHRIIFHAIDRYFAFSRFIIYTKPRLENNLGMRYGDQRLPERFDINAFVPEFYGRRAAELLPRPVVYLRDTGVDDPIEGSEDEIQPLSYDDPVRPAYILKTGKKPPQEERGAILIEAASALCESKFAYTENSRKQEVVTETWSYCLSPAHGETGLAMYLRTKQGHRLDVQLRGTLISRTGPCLHYSFDCKGGSYRIWARMLLGNSEGAHFTIGIDDKVYAERELYHGQSIWRFSVENMWVWVPLIEVKIRSGRHMLHFFALSAGFRVEQFYLTQGDGRPPISA